jgi:hypothetical protein
MKLKKVTPRSGVSLYLALALALIFITSCQKDSATNSETTPALANSATGSFATVIKSAYKVSKPLTYNGVKNITISGDSINGGTVPCISLINCTNIRITHCKLINSKTLGISISGCTSIRIDSNFVGNVSTGVYAVDSKSIQVFYNQMRNMQGPFPRGAFVQFDNVSGTYNRVSYNKLENILGQSYPEDAISMYKSNGLVTDKIYIQNNWIRGGGPSKSGGGIMLGDNGGSYQVATNNILVNPGQYGMAVSGGTHMQISNNEIYAKAQSFTNVGLYYWNQSGLSSSDITISSNKVNFTSGTYGINNSYIGPGNATPTGWSTNTWNAKISSTILPTTIITMN